jgi:hypothetical protein
MLTPLRRRPDKISHGWSPARGTNTRKGSPHESVKVFKCHTSTSMDLGCFTKSRGAPKSGQFRRAVPPLKRLSSITDVVIVFHERSTRSVALIHSNVKLGGKSPVGVKGR